MLQKLRVRGYRALRDVVLPLARCTVVLGASRTGKTNLHRVMKLVADVSDGPLG